jgi:hypothetical protein
VIAQGAPELDLSRGADLHALQAGRLAGPLAPPPRRAQLGHDPLVNRLWGMVLRRCKGCRRGVLWGMVLRR